MSLEGKVAIITGAGRGLGRAVCKVLAGRGVAVLAMGRTASHLETLVSEVRAEGGAIEMVAGNVGDRADVSRTVETAVARFGGIDILVNNAQTLEYGVHIMDITDERIEIPFRSGTLGTLYFMQACYPHLKARGGGAIVNYGSGASLEGLDGFGPYAIAKEAIRGLTRAAAREWGPDNIRLNVICPSGLTEGTAAFLEANPQMKAKAEILIPLRRIGDPEADIGAFIAALVSDDMKYLTGATINLDGGKFFIN